MQSLQLSLQSQISSKFNMFICDKAYHNAIIPVFDKPISRIFHSYTSNSRSVSQGNTP